MTWLRKLTTGARKEERVPSKFPVQVELVPGKLFTRVHLNEIGSRDGAVPCWTYVTEGLRTHGQKELIFPLRRRPEEKPGDFPDEPLKFFATVYHYAEQGQLVDVGDFTELFTSDFLGHKGFLYLSPKLNEDVEGLDAALTMIMLTEEELEAVKAFGPARVMARLGLASHYYPCPPWSDRDRSGLPFARSMQESLLAKVNRVWPGGIRVREENNVITLRLLPPMAEHVRDRISQWPEDVSLALLTDLDPLADGCLVWQPGQSQPAAITPPDSSGTRRCGCFMLFVPEGSEDRGGLFEDGYGILLTKASWARIKSAIAAGKPVSIPATSEGMSFQLEWIETTYHNPVDGISYHSDGGWESWGPLSPGNQESDEDVKLTRFILFTPERVLFKRTSLEDFTAYTQAIEKTVRDHFASLPMPGGQDLITQFEVSADGRVAIGFATRPSTDEEAYKKLYISLAALRLPKVYREAIKFQIAFSIRGGSGEPDLLLN